MQLIKYCSAFVFCSLFASSVNGQNVKSESIEYRYVQPPMTPLPATIKNYQSSIFATYEAENQKKIADYEADVLAAEMEFKKEQDAYPAKLKAAEDKYAMEMAEWDKKSMAEKVVEKQLLNENNKPVKQVPSQPYKRSVSYPKLKTSYDYPVLAASNLSLDGYINSPENAVKIEVTIYGFEYTPPRQLTEQKNVVSSAKGTTTTSQVTYYRVEFTYRHTMSVRVSSPDGKELFVVSPSELNNYQTYKSGESKTSIAINEAQLVKTYEEKILQDNLKFINELVNDRIGFKHALRASELHYVKNKAEEYADLLNAFNEASSGLKMLLDDKSSAISKLEKSVLLWETALKESDLTNKKARIDKGVSTMIYFNLLEVHFALGNIASGNTIIETLNTMALSSGDRKSKEAYELAYLDLKKRIEANK